MEVLLSTAFLHVCGILVKARFNTGSAESYLIALMGIVCTLYIGGLFNLLFPVMVCICIAVPVLLLLNGKKWKRGGGDFVHSLRVKAYFSPFVLLNALSCVIFAVIFSVSRPLFYYWDELAFWGSAAKATKVFDRLYSVWPTPLHNHLPPANGLLNYFFNFFSADFEPYILLLSYAFLFFAVFSLVAELAHNKSGSLSFAVAVYVLLLFSPFMSVAHTAGINYETLLYAYGTAMVDFNIAVVFLSAVALYLCSPHKKWYLLPLVFLVNMKNTGVFFALLAGCVVLCFTVFDVQAKKRVAETVKSGLLLLLVVALSYGSWFVHLNAFEPKEGPPILLQDPAYLVEREQGMKANEPLNLNALSIVFPSLRSEKYNAVMKTMYEELLHQKTNLFVPDRYFVALLAAAGISVALVSERGKRLRALCVSAGVGIGCYVYCAAVSYFVSYYTDGMVEYPRYMSSYYFLWLYIVLLLAVISRRGRRGKQAVLCAVSLAALFLVGTPGLDYTAINAPDTPYLEYIETEQDMQQIQAVFEKEDRVYLVLPDQDTWGYMKYRYHLMPAVCNQDTKGTGIDFTISFRESLAAGSDRQYYNIASSQTYAWLMAEYFDYVLVLRPDAGFRDSYSHLFSDGMTEGTLYRVTEQEIPMQVVGL